MIYSIIYELAYFLARLAAPFVPKLKTYFAERKTITKDLKNFVPSTTTPVFWVHCASMGEFEMIRPLLKSMERTFPNAQRVITFFSSSGYTIFKKTPLANVVSYLPLDRKKDLNSFLNMIQPTALLLVKYEFWPNLIRQTAMRNIPIYSISSTFREKQIFFSRFSWGMRKVLKKINYFFVLNEQSKNLLNTLGIEKVEVIGDTRFDRVLEGDKRKKTASNLNTFVGKELCFIAGSTWPEDHEIILSCCTLNSKFKWIIAPHKVDSISIEKLEKQLKLPTAKWSTYSPKKDQHKRVLILDTIGQLAQAYQWAHLAYIGGGMGKKGLHNTLEAAVHGLPIIIGKHYERYPEAVDMITGGGMISVRNQEEFESHWSKLVNNDELRNRKGGINRSFVKENAGATAKIISYLKSHYNR